MAYEEKRKYNSLSPGLPGEWVGVRGRALFAMSLSPLTPALSPPQRRGEGVVYLFLPSVSNKLRGQGFSDSATPKLARSRFGLMYPIVKGLTEH